ncbi:MAG TPA: hypothetical protein VGZ52_00720 [Acidimicrobiales bacterium]|nr:hypothetical protein [Acidimicrobiales bacterium]
MSVSTRWCLLCGSEYVVGVLECADCLVPLSDRQPLKLEELGGDDDEQVAYDFDELEPRGRLVIDELFWRNGIAHAWDETSLVVRVDDEAESDRLIDEADRDAFLDSDVEQVSYELADWDDDRRGQLTETLTAAGIEHAWDEHGELVVLEEDEDRVEAIVDAIEFPDQLAVDDDAELAAEEALAADGLDPQDVLSDLFVAADRLMHDPLDHEGVLSLVDASRLAETLPLPYGFAPAVWNDLVAQARGLRDLLEESGDVDDEKIIDQATSLRGALRNFV